MMSKMDKFLVKRSAESESQESVEPVMKTFKKVCRQYSKAYYLSVLHGVIIQHVHLQFVSFVGRYSATKVWFQAVVEASRYAILALFYNGRWHTA
jgi:hypothetical protein